MNKKWSVVAFLVTMAALGFAFLSPKQPPFYKNLQVLPKDIGEHDMDSIMHLYSGSLGKKCSFCHVKNTSTDQWDFASDQKKNKLVAREMMKMTDSINRVYFPEGRGTNQAITCYTCHHGDEEPVRIPPLKE